MTHLRIRFLQMRHCCKNPIYCFVCIGTGCRDMSIFVHAQAEEISAGKGKP
jgi:hypothetical protein